MNEFKYDLGVTLKHRITGFTGVVRGRSQYLTGCNQYALQNKKLNKDGLPTEWQWYDENILEQVKNVKKISLDSKEKKTGGPSKSYMHSKNNG